MSAISEVDINDWERIDVKKAREVLEDLDDLSRMNIGVVPVGQYNFMQKFIDAVEEIQRKQTRQIPALFKPIYE